MSGSLTISSSGTPARLKSTRLPPPCASWMFLPASSSMWMRVRPMRRVLAVDDDLELAAGADGSSYCRSDSPSAGRGRSSSCARSASAARCVQPVASPARIANSTTRRFSTGSTPGMPRQTGQTLVLGGAPNAAEQPQKIFERVSSWACTSRPMTASNPSCVHAHGSGLRRCQSLAARRRRRRGATVASSKGGR